MAGTHKGAAVPPHERFVIRVACADDPGIFCAGRPWKYQQQDRYNRNYRKGFKVLPSYCLSGTAAYHDQIKL
ncbi:MAG: hypothetical protein MI863_14090 [Desulfobacterales bacterium]|nr:hypothetical protein [Desulfobacterales bacterium]